MSAIVTRRRAGFAGSPGRAAEGSGDPFERSVRAIGGRPVPARAVAARDQVAVPVEALLGHALERRVVDVDDPEALRVAEPPLEVVEQRPDEVAADRRALRDRLPDRGQVLLEV